MSALWVERTPAATRFRDKAGHANYRLNTIIVGLEGVKRGTAVKPDDLAVRWESNDVTKASELARGYATNSMMVYVVDALDGYMIDIANSDTWVKDAEAASILRNEFYVDRTEVQALTGNAVDLFASRLSEFSSSHDELERSLRDFISRHFGRRKRPSMRLRFDKLREISSLSPPSPHYCAAVRLLISWRNRHVHGKSTERISETTKTELLTAAERFYTDHSHLDVRRMIENYDAGGSPTLKEVSSLISVLHRTVATIDRAILSSLIPKDTFVSALTFAFSREPHPLARIKEYWGRTCLARKGKLIAMAGQSGFRIRAADEDVPAALSLSEEDILRYAEMPRDEFAALVGVNTP